jgi:two-component system LytT family response regulator
MTLRAYVVDDERLAVQRLTRMLEATGRVEVVGSTTDPEAALDVLNREAIDVLFLDIQMPGLTGFALIDRLQRDIPVVFTTAYDQYALNAFEVNSIDYLLKPIERERLDRAIDKLERMLGNTGTGLRTTRGDLSGTGLRTAQGDLSPLRALARELAAELAPHHRLARIASRVGERTTVLDVGRITHFFAQDKLTFAASGGRDHVIDYTLAQLEERLEPRRFVRIHRATIVNLAFVQELYPGIEGMVARLKDEKKTELTVARDRVRDLKERLGI